MSMLSLLPLIRRIKSAETYQYSRDAATNRRDMKLKNILVVVKIVFLIKSYAQENEILGA